MGAEAGGSDVGRLRVDGTQAPQATPHQRRAPEQSMARCVGLLLTDPASGSRTVHVVAPLTSRRRSTADPVEVPLRAAPVAGPELAYVHRGEAILFLDRARQSVPHDGTEPSVRPAPLPCGGSTPRYGLLDGPGVDAGLMLREGAGLPDEDVRPLIAGQPAVGGNP